MLELEHESDEASMVETTTNESPAAMTVEQVAEKLQIHPETVRREIRRGHLRAKRIGRSLRISVAELARYLSPEESK